MASCQVNLNFHFVKFSLCKPASTSFGLHSFKYFACKIWNSLPERIRNEPILTNFKRLLKTVSF